jgi:uncharacterized protein YdhG (YjbR/CyaY superfamily)
MNMFKPTKAKTVAEYIKSVPEERKNTILKLHNLIRKTVPKLKAHFANNMLGYGSFLYRNYKKEIINWPVVALANQKNYISVYVCSIVDGQYVAEKYRKELGKVSIGKSCIRFKKIDDVNLSAFKKVLEVAAKNPGLVQD